MSASRLGAAVTCAPAHHEQSVFGRRAERLVANGRKGMLGRTQQVLLATS